MKFMHWIKAGIILAALSVGCFSYSAETDKPEAELGYYENLSSLYFVYTSAYFDSVDNDNEKMGAYRDFVTASFVYWLKTREGDLPPSQKVDKGIRVVWESHFKEYRDGREFLGDPLGWAVPERQETHGVSGFKDMTKAEYREYLKRYHEFLNEDFE